MANKMMYSVETLPRMDAEIKRKVDLHTNQTIKGKITFEQQPIMPEGNLNGTNYLMVYGTGTPTENAAELQAAYNEAKTMPRYLGEIINYSLTSQFYKGQTLYNEEYLGSYYRIEADEYSSLDNLTNNPTEISEAEAKSTRTTLIVAPGDYDFGSTSFYINTPYIDVVSLTGNPDVFLKSQELGDMNGVRVLSDNIFVKGINSSGLRFHTTEYISPSSRELKLENCVGGDSSFGGNFGDGGFYGTAVNCIGGMHSFGSSDGGDSGGMFDGKAINCTGGENSFGGIFVAEACVGILENCKLTSGTFPIPTGAGKIYNCIDGNGNLVNYPELVVNMPNRAIKYLNTDGNYSILPTEEMILIDAESNNLILPSIASAGYGKEIIVTLSYGFSSIAVLSCQVGESINGNNTLNMGNSSPGEIRSVSVVATGSGWIITTTHVVV